MFMRVVQQCDSHPNRSFVRCNIFLGKIDYFLRFVLKDSRSKIPIDELKISKKIFSYFHSFEAEVYDGVMIDTKKTE